MNPRSRAIAILQQARERLAQRLTERIVDAEAEILADAEGAHYLSEIETLYDQLGGRLAHVTTMLSHLPPADEPMQGEPVAPEGPIYSDIAGVFPTSGEPVGPGGTLALPPPTLEERPQLASVPVSIHSFAIEVQMGDLEMAGRSLADLFALDLARARHCAGVFAERLSADPSLLIQMMRLRSELQAGNTHAAMLLLWECFGLQGLESLAVLQTLKTRLAGPRD